MADTNRVTVEQKFDGSRTDLSDCATENRFGGRQPLDEGKRVINRSRGGKHGRERLKNESYANTTRGPTYASPRTAIPTAKNTTATAIEATNSSATKQSTQNERTRGESSERGP